MEIQLLTPEEIPAAIELIWSVFDEFEGPDYSMEGVEEFRKSVNCETITDMVARSELRLWGCNVNGQLAGVIATRGINHVSLLFVRKDYHRQGIARKLFDRVVTECREQGGVHRITVNSSPYAVEAYHRLGFVDTDAEKIINGIRFTPMEFVINR